MKLRGFGIGFFGRTAWVSLLAASILPGLGFAADLANGRLPGETAAFSLTNTSARTVALPPPDTQISSPLAASCGNAAGFNDCNATLELHPMPRIASSMAGADSSVPRSQATMTFAGVISFSPGAAIASELSDPRASRSFGDSPVGLNAPRVPEPDTYAMVVAGLGLMGFVARRRRKEWSCE